MDRTQKMTSSSQNNLGRRRILVVGESLVDIVVDAAGMRSEHVGGSPANLARGLSRLGNDVSLLTTFGEDARGRVIERDLRGAGLHVIQAGRPETQTSTATARLDQNGSAGYTFDISWELDTTEPPSCDHLHVGSIAVVQEPGASEVARLVSHRDRSTTVSYDVNIRPTLMSPRAEAIVRIDEMLTRSDIVKLSEEDLAWLRPGERYADAVRWLMSHGPSLVAVTHGAAGVIGYARDGSVLVGGRRVNVVDTIGAGDAFMAGLLHALCDRKLLAGDAGHALRAISLDDLRHVLHIANTCASLAVMSPGAQPPTLDELSAAS
ncbi:carbohydrate kinase [Rhodococcus opacus]|uniref:carbohydrate kinase family protein n=1 Tax=Rhodococcus opacus TaxID=37919 RepID=UPI001FF19F80|nr:carbohydrate kinase [Rhodococcus opacus]UOT04174.1 carbohydrate kinase [Rhodococcus opacus]